MRKIIQYFNVQELSELPMPAHYMLIEDGLNDEKAPVGVRSQFYQNSGKLRLRSLSKPISKLFSEYESK